MYVTYIFIDGEYYDLNMMSDTNELIKFVSLAASSSKGIQ